MNVRSRGEAGLAHASDHPLLAHTGADLDSLRVRGQVAVIGDVAVVVANLHQTAESALPALEEHLAIRHRPHRRAVRCRVIDTLMRTTNSQNGMHA